MSVARWRRGETAAACPCVHHSGTSTLVEIEKAIEQLPPEELDELRTWLAGQQGRTPLAKWNGHGTGVVKQAGGVDAYLRSIRKSDDDSR